jgi:uncharacterized integral membrane protein
MTEEMHPSPQPDRKPRDRGRDVRMVVTGIAAVLLVWFAFVNVQDVTIHFWLHTERSPLIVVILISGLLGVLLGAVLSRRTGEGRPSRRLRRRGGD